MLVVQWIGPQWSFRHPSGPHKPCVRVWFLCVSIAKMKAENVAHHVKRNFICTSQRYVQQQEADYEKTKTVEHQLRLIEFQRDFFESSSCKGGNSTSIKSMISQVDNVGHQNKQWRGSCTYPAVFTAQQCDMVRP